MSEKRNSISRTARILSVYHLLNHCEEVSVKELSGLLQGCVKTFSRDIAFLKSAGVAVRYSASRQAYVLERTERGLPASPDSKPGLLFMKKILRLMIMMDEMPEEDCGQWYADTFPWQSRRTMQRDFAALNAVGYRIKYERESFNSHDAGFDVPPRRYYCDRPQDAYDLNTFKK
jgi:predicted DNA-binding transcriptional regulator YafY